MTCYIINNLTLLGCDPRDSNDSVEYPVSCLTPVLGPNSLSTVSKDEGCPLAPGEGSILQQLILAKLAILLIMSSHLCLVELSLWARALFGVWTNHSAKDYQVFQCHNHNFCFGYLLVCDCFCNYPSCLYFFHFSWSPLSWSMMMNGFPFSTSSSSSLTSTSGISTFLLAKFCLLCIFSSCCSSFNLHHNQSVYLNTNIIKDSN
jgi:hypothetical protein